VSFFEDFFNNPLGTTKKTVDDVWDWSLDLVGDVISWFIEIPELPDFGSQQQGFLVNKQANDQPIPIVYGERLIGGTRVFVETAGTDNKNLYICLALCEGPVDAIGDIYIDDVLSTDSKYSGLVTIDKKLGASPQTGSSTLEEAPSWTTSHRLNGIAYLGIKIVFDADVFRGLPTITAKVRGRKVYDPRKDSTSTVYDAGLGVSSHRSNSPATWEWSDNPALCLRDYLTDDLYGKGIPYSEIDEQGVADGADFCDETVTEYTGGSSQSIYRCNAVLDTGQSIFNNTTALLKGMRGMLPFSNGKYKLVIDDDPASSVFTFNAGNIISDISVASNSRKQRYNRCVAKFANKDVNYQPDEIAYPEKDSTEYTTFKTEDNGIEQELQLDLPTITAVYQARDIARVAVLSSRQQSLSVSFTADSSAIRVEVGDLVLLTYTALGFTNKQFKCRGMSINPDSTCSFQLLEHDATAYPWEVLSEVDDLSSPAFVDPADVAFPTLATGTPSLEEVSDADGAIRKFVKFEAPESSYEYVDYYDVQYREQSSDWFSFHKDTPVLQIYGYRTGFSYRFRYAIVNIFGQKSAYSTERVMSIGSLGRDEFTGESIKDESEPVGKLKPASSFDFLGTSSNPKYKFFLGPSGSGSGFENSDYAIGGKSYQANEGGMVAYAEQGPPFTAFGETDSASSSHYSGNFFGGYNLSANKAPSRAEIAAFNAGGRFRVGNINSHNVSNVTSANPAVVTTSTVHNLNSDDIVYFSGFTGIWSFMDGSSSTITVLSDTTFETTFDLSTVVSYSSNAGVIKSSRPLYVEDGTSADVYLARAFEGAAYSIYTNVGTAGPFTASHDGLIEKQIEPELGDILIDVEVKAAPSINDAITSVAISSQANQVGVIGVFAGDLGASFVPASLGEDSPFVWNNQVPSGGQWVLKAEHEHLFDTYKTIKINSIGEGKINVCGQAGNISVGDLIVASDTQGKGMKQSDDIIRSYTVAKSRENVTFTSADEVKQIACIYLGG
jgi:hypothetical protein